jgi:hypothetical protein
LELPDDSSHIVCRALGFYVKSCSKLSCDVSYGRRTIASVPDIACRLVELVNQSRLTIEYYRFTLNNTNAHVKPSFRIMVCHIEELPGFRAAPKPRFLLGCLSRLPLIAEKSSWRFCLGLKPKHTITYYIPLIT